MRADVPQWLIQAYVRSVQTAGSTLSKEQLADACYRVIETWSSADRSYHGLNHVIDVLTRLEELLPETHDPCLVRLAAWYHGIAFSASAEDAAAHTAGENIPSSATAAEYHLKDLGVDPEKATRVARLIRGLKRTDLKNPAETAQFHAVDIDELALRDAHLGTLAVDPQRYKKYLQKVSQEYAHIAPAEFLAARKAIVSRILARRQIFVTPLARQWDAQARENLEAELERINRALALSAKSAAIEAARAENLEDAPTAGTPQEGPTAKAPPRNQGLPKRHRLFARSIGRSRRRRSARTRQVRLAIIAPPRRMRPQAPHRPFLHGGQLRPRRPRLQAHRAPDGRRKEAPTARRDRCCHAPTHRRKTPGERPETCGRCRSRFTSSTRTTSQCALRIQCSHGHIGVQRAHRYIRRLRS